MTRIEYIRLSHRRTNRKIRERLQAVRSRLDAKSRWLGGAWQAVAWVLYGTVSVVSWLAFAAEMFKDNRFSLHYMECEIEHRNLSTAEARRYIAGKKQEYDRWLAYGSVSTKEQRRIDKTFEYLFARYPADTPADELLTRIAEVRTTVTEIAGYTRHRQTEEQQRKEHEAELLAQAEKRRATQRSRTGFDPTPTDFCPRMTDRQIAVLTEHVNRIGIFKRDTTEEELSRLLACQLAEPLQTTHNKLLALAARIVERIPADYPEMAAGRRKQRLFYLEVGQTADGERPLGGQTNGRNHRPPQRADDPRLHRSTGSNRIVSTRSSLTGFRSTGILFFHLHTPIEPWKHCSKMSKHGQPMRTAYR